MAIEWLDKLECKRRTYHKKKKRPNMDDFTRGAYGMEEQERPLTGTQQSRPFDEFDPNARRTPRPDSPRGWSQFAYDWRWFFMTFGLLMLLFAVASGIAFWVHHDGGDGLHDDDDSCGNYTPLTTIFETGEPEGVDGGWWSWGRDLYSTRFARYSRLNEDDLDPDDIKAAFGITGEFITTSNVGVSTSPTVDAETNIVYFADWGDRDVDGITTNAKVWAVGAKTGAPIWSHLVSDYCSQVNPLITAGLPLSIASEDANVLGERQVDVGVVNLNAIVRVSPTLTVNGKGQKILVFGDLGTSMNAALTNTCISEHAAGNFSVCGPRAYGVDPATGVLLWRTLATPIIGDLAYITGIFTSSPTVFANNAYFGLSSSVSGDVADTTSPFSNSSAGDPTLWMGAFVGRMLAFDVTTGLLQLEFATMPTGFGFHPDVRAYNYTGAAVWGSAPPVDPESGNIFFGSGNLYSQSDAASACLLQPGFTEGELRRMCLETNVYNGAVFAFNTDFSAAVGQAPKASSLSPDWASWINTPYGVDAWNVACLFRIPQGTPGFPCPEVPGPDYDMGTGFVLIKAECGRTLIIAMQKSGIMWAFDGSSGDYVWHSYVGPGSTLVNSWGMAFDGEGLYVSVANTANTPWVSVNNGDVYCNGLWAKVHPETGQVLWTTPAPCSMTPAECLVANGNVPVITPDPFLIGVIGTDELTYSDRPTPDWSGTEVDVSDSVECGAGDPRDSSIYARGHGALTVAGDVLLAGSSDGYMYVIATDSGNYDTRLPRCPTGGIYGGATVARLGTEKSDEFIYWGCGYRPEFGVLGDAVVMGWTLK